MTTKPFFPKMNDVKKIVINHVSVWEKKGEEWHKITGGPGFNPESKSHVKNPNQMKSLVIGKLSRTHNVKVFQNYNTVVFEDKILYRYWISEGTLNIVMRNV